MRKPQACGWLKVVLLLVTGSSCSGKSTAAAACRGLDSLSIHDSDELGVPSHADTAWRQTNLRQWVRMAADLDSHGADLLLTSQSPLGELLAVPESGALDLAVCLIDVQDSLRSERLERRDPGTWSPEAKKAFNNWAAWHRHHAHDPQYAPDVITEGAALFMRSGRWASWTHTDPRWHVTTLDSSHDAPATTARRLRSWVDSCRSEDIHSPNPLRRGWAD